MTPEKIARGSTRWVLVPAVLFGLVALLLSVSHRFLPMNDAPSHIANAVIAHKLLAGDALLCQSLPLRPCAGAVLGDGAPDAALQKLFVPLIAWRIITGSYLVLLPLSLLVLWRSMQDPAAQAESQTSRSATASAARRADGVSLGLLDGASQTTCSASRWRCLRWPCFAKSRKLGSASFVGFVLLAALSICVTSTR